ncbi:electron transport complex, RnfABCDGE type, subunit E [Candidatus Desulfofervidus auxilii]|uniref:Ion-translocating oxidoreductase complex subunit E n=1 Tax=Desulfofervidus auxilii TaxID=1621989 RepID=A0A7C1VQ47_DESA2|nr:electron transport complex subunit E [Candidatus Desulfofervidus auxilii]RKY41046.1 MAG: electron transport complex subunit E [Candidatus Omnitrophota bacterium]CAD7778138.1 Electron transport complex subunit RnfE [Candidatus Methanoperedenaceae archaeon GB50]CAD7779263.1 Electron transport complex subunit RnfE [Candidatus Methanoperedenaceae archaeon GB37]AMM41417.1 electron transport complex, RnfABCDGE type, subunit E [Candidatus Desulfofervidus auxilii]HEC68543.1 electron transport compl
MAQKKSWLKEFTKGLWDEIPPFRFVLGLCPTLACSTAVTDGFGMGLCLTFVVTGANIFISFLRKIIPDEVRIACFIVIIATFVIIVELATQAYFYPLYLSLGIFIPLIVVNCIVLGRAEAFASKNSISLSIADGLGMGLGFTMSLTTLAIFREVLGKGSFAGHFIMWQGFEPFALLQKPPGAFFCLGLMLGIMNLFGKK